MGELKDRAKKQSKFLLVDKGESVVVQLVGWKPVPSELNPEEEVILYHFTEDGADKFWKNGSAKIMNALDSANPGDFIRITRSKFIKKDQTEDLSKSSWSAVILPGYDPKTGKDMNGTPIVQKKPIYAPETGIVEDFEGEDPFAV